MLNMKDIGSFNSTYATNVLFVSNYLEHGPDFPLQGAELWNKNPGKVAGAWLSNSMDNATQTDHSIIVGHTKALSSVFSADKSGLFYDCSHDELLTKLWSGSSEIPSATADHQRRVKQQIENNRRATTESLKGWKSLLSSAINSWSNDTHFWDTAVAGFATDHKIWKEKVNQGFLTEHWANCSIKSSNLKDWIDDGKTSSHQL
jgi:hypothetical protein